jgi:hypothetical protein
MLPSYGIQLHTDPIIAREFGAAQESAAHEKTAKAAAATSKQASNQSATLRT